MKTCTKCKVGKPVTGFHRDKSRKDGLRHRCKTCDAVYQVAHRADNPEKIAAKAVVYRASCPEKCAAYGAAYRAGNPEKNAAKNAMWQAADQAANPAKYAARNAERKAAKLQATPAWADQGKIKFIYAQASEAGLHVDHVVPLKSKLVCGLHVEHNLRPLAAAPNCSKGNRHWPDMPSSIGAAA